MERAGLHFHCTIPTIFLAPNSLCFLASSRKRILPWGVTNPSESQVANFENRLAQSSYFKIQALQETSVFG